MLKAKIRWLEADKSIALQKGGQFQNQQVSMFSFIQQTAASVQNLLLASTITQPALSHNNATTFNQLGTMIGCSLRPSEAYGEQFID